MSGLGNLATTVAPPRAVPVRASTRKGRAGSPSIDGLIVEFATASDLRSGMTQLVAGLRRFAGVEQVEWWGPDERGLAPRVRAATGAASGRRSAFPLGAAGTVVVVGNGWSSTLALAIARLAPLVRRRWADERLAEQATRLARANNALEDYADLVACKLKGPLSAALQCPDPQAVTTALDLVDSLLVAARCPGAVVSPGLAA